MKEFEKSDCELEEGELQISLIILKNIKCNYESGSKKFLIIIRKILADFLRIQHLPIPRAFPQPFLKKLFISYCFMKNDKKNSDEIKVNFFLYLYFFKLYRLLMPFMEAL